MTHIAVTMECACPACGMSATAQHVISYRPQVSVRPNYSESVTCGSCNHATIADGGDIDDQIRQAFVHEDGVWGLHLVDSGPRRLELAKSLGGELGVSRIDALRIVSDIPALVQRGLRPELERLADAIARVGGVTKLEQDT